MSTEIEELEKLLAADTRPSIENAKIVVVQSVASEVDSLSEIIKTRDNISKVKENLNVIIDCIADNPSIVTRLSSVWGNMPTWQKVAPLVITVPPLLMPGIGSLLAFGGATVVYSTSAIILEDHHSCNENIKQRLREGISSIADILEITIVALDTIRARLIDEVDKFTKENEKLAKQVISLQTNLSDLHMHIEAIQDIESDLRESQDKLKKEIVELSKNSKEEKELLRKKQEELDTTSIVYKKTQEELSKKIEELRRLREELATEITKTKNISEVLEKAVGTLSTQLIEEQKQKQEFERKLNSLIQGKEDAANRLIDNMSNTHQALKSAKEDLELNNKRHKELLAQQEELIKKLETIDLKQVRKLTQSVTQPSKFKGTLFNKVSSDSGVDGVQLGEALINNSNL